MATPVTKAGSDVRDSAPPLVGRAWTGLAVPFLLVLIGGLPSGGAEAQALTVQRFNFRGLAEGDSTYYLNEVVRLRVFFTQHITVDTSGGEPYVDLTIGSTTRRAAYNSSRQNYLGFSYRVQADDLDDDGVSVPANGLTLNGAVVTAKNNPAVVADPAHGLAEGGLSRKVDGSQVRPPDPTLSAVGASVAEGGAGAETDLEFAVRLSPAAGARVTVDYSDAGSGTATSGEDYAAIEGGTLTFEPGETLKTVWVKVRGDDVVEDDETVVLALSGATNAELATRTVRGTIVDDDEAPPALTVERIDFRDAPGGDSTYYRGEIVRVRVFFSQRIAVDASGGLPSVDLTVGTETRRAVMGSRSWNQNRLELRYTVQEGDYDADGVSVQANSLALNGAVVTAQNDASVRAETAHGAADGGAAHKVDGSQVRPPDPTLSAVGASVAEGGAGAETDLEFAVRLSPAAGARVTVDYSDAGSGTATSGEDYAAIEGGTLTFEPGDTLKTVWVKVRGDDAEEDDETVVLALSGATNAELATRTVRGTIVDDDEAPPALTVQRFNFRGLAEGDSTYYLNEVVRLRVFFTQHITVDTSGGEPYVDLTIGSTTRRAAYNSSRQNYLGFSYRVQADDLDDDGVSVPANGLQLNGAVVTAKDNSAVVADPAHGLAEGGLSRKVDGSQVRPQGPTVSAEGASVAEGGAGAETDLEFAVRLSPAAGARVTVDYSDAGSGTATSGEDYAAIEGGTLTFEPGETLKTVWVKVRGDDVVEDDETVVLALSGATNAELATRTVRGTIVDDDEAPPALTVERIDFRDAPGGDSTYYRGEIVRVRVFFSQRIAVDASGGLPSVDLTVGTETRRAVMGSRSWNQNRLELRYTVQEGDYDADGVSVQANSLALNGAVVTAQNDASVRAETAHGAADGGAAHKVDGSQVRPPDPTLSAVGASVAEGGAGAETDLEFAVRLSPAAGARVTVDYSDAGSGTATSGEDYAAIEGGTLTFEPGDTLKTVWVKVRGDDAEEDDETVVLALSGATNAELATRTVRGTIVDDDEAPPALTVQRFNFRGLAEGDSTYYLNEVVRLRVFFTQHITVDTSGGEPYVDLTIGSTTRRAAYNSSRQNYLGFSYRVQADDLDDDGVSVPANGLQLNGAVVTAKDNSAVVADPAHGLAEGGLSRKVDGSQVRPQGPTVSAEGASVAEGGAGAETDLEFAVRLSPAAGARVTVDYADAGSGTATSGEDYAAIEGGTLTFEPGETLKTVWVKVRGDDVVEDDETVVLALSGATNAELATRTVRGTIVDDDEAPTVEHIALLGLADGDSTYYRGESVRVRMRFSQHITVDTSDGEPYVDLIVGSTTRRADLVAWKLNRIDFRYVVQAADFDADGVSVPANSLTLDGAVVTAKNNPAVAVDPAHGVTEGGLSRKVDGSQVRPQGPTVSAEGASVVEGGAGAETDLEFAVRLSPAAGARVTVDYSDAGNGTATSGEDYAAIEGGTLTFEPGDTLKTVWVKVRGDDAEEDDETVVLALSGATNAELATRTVRGTIVDDDEAPPALTVNQIVFRGLGASDSTYYRGEVVRVRVRFSQHVTVDTSGGEPYVDLTIGSTTRRANFGSSRQNYLDFSYRVQADDFDSDGVSVPANSLTLNGAVVTAKDNPAVVADPAHGVAEGGLSRKVDGSQVRPPGPAVARVDFRGLAEGDSTYYRGEIVRVRVFFTQRIAVDASDGLPSVDLTVGAETRQAVMGPRSWNQNRLELRYTVQEGDYDADGVSVQANSLALNGAVITAQNDASARADTAHGPVDGGVLRKVDGGRIRPQGPTLSAGGASVVEGGTDVETELEFEVWLGPPATTRVTVDYADAGSGMATSGEDYAAIEGGTLTFEPGETLKTVSATVLGDDELEGDETLVLALSGAANAELATRSVTGTIVDDDGPRPTVSIDPVSIHERGPEETATLSFTVSISAPTARQVTVRYRDAGTGTATPGDDYDPVTPGTLVFAAEDTAQTLNVTVQGDAMDEPAETIVLALANAFNADLPVGGATGVGTIVDDDDAPTLSADSPSVEEGNSGGRRLTFALALDRPSGHGLAVHYADADTGTATSGADYEAVSPDTLFFEPGETTKSISVMVMGDTLQERDETVVLRLSALDPALVAISETLITGRIRDDDGDDLVPSFGDASMPSQRWIRACEIPTLQLPPAEGGDAPLTYGLAPAPPPGLKFDAERRTIAGTPMQEQPLTTYRYTATDEDGDSATLSFAAQVDLADCVFEGGDGRDADGDPLAEDDTRSEVPPTVDQEDGETEQATLSEADADGSLTTGPAVGAQSSTPTVNQIVIAGLAEGDSTYHRGEIVRVRVHFTPRITVDASGGLPYVDLTVGTTTRRAQMGARSWNQNRIEFRYTVQADDLDSDGVSVPANSLKLNGATVVAQSDTTVHANVAHDSAAGGLSRKVDGSKYRPPEVTGVTFSNSPASGNTYGYGEQIEATVAVNHRVQVTTTGGTPTLALTIGAHTRQATLTRAGRRNRLTFSYTVQSADLAPTGVSIAANALSLNGGKITHDADTATHAVLAHGAVAADTTRKVSGRQGRPPKVEGIAFGAAPKDSVYWRGDTIAVRVGFDDSVAVNTAGGKPQVALTIGAATRQATFSAHAGKALEFAYVVQAADRDSDGVSIAANALALNGATIRGVGAASARDADVTHPLVEASAARTVDGSKVRAPAVRGVAFAGSVPEGGTYHYDAEVRVEVLFDRSVVVNVAGGSPRLALAVGAQQRHAAFVPSASTTTALVFAYRVQSADVDSDGASVGANALDLNGGAIKAAADSTVSANVTHDALASDLTRKVDGRPRITGLKLFRRGGSPPPRGVHGYQERLGVLARFDQQLILRKRVHLSLEVGADTVQLRSRSNLREKGSAVAFFYDVTRDAVDTDGVSVPKGALQLSGGWLRAASDGVTNARLEHDELPADSSWRVNGSLTPVPRPAVSVHDFPAVGSTYTRHEHIRLGVSYSAEVVVTGTPELTLNLGTGTRRVPAVRSTLHELFFEYVVQAGDLDGDGISVPANALSLPSGATVRSAADTSLVTSLTHDSVPTSASHKVDGSRVAAAEVRWVSINPPPSADSTYTRGETFYVNVIFDRAVAVDTTGGRPRIALEIGDSTRYAMYSHAHSFGPTNQVFDFVVQAGDVDTDGLSIAANALELNGGTITAPDDTVSADLSHDALTLGSPYKVNGDRSDAPHARWMWFHAPASGDTFLRDDRVVLTVTFDRPTAVDTVGGRPRVALQVGDSTRHATYIGHPRTGTSFNFEYVVQAGDVDADGLSIPANALGLNGGSFTLPGTTTAAVLTHDSLPTSAAHKVDGSRTSGDAEPEENRPPEVVSAIAPMTIEVASPAAVVDLSAHFRDPDGDELGYSAVSAAPRSVRADVTGGTLTVVPLAVGESLVTVRAADPDGAEAEQSFMVTVEASRADRARIMKRSLAAFGRAVGTETVEAIGGRLGAADDGPGAAAGEAHLQVGGRLLSCVGAGERCGLGELARQAAGVLGLRASQGAGSLASVLWAAAKGSHDAGALRGLAGAFGRPGETGATAGFGTSGSFGPTANLGPTAHLGSAAGYGAGGFGATADGAAAPDARFAGPRGGRAGWGRLVSVDPVSREELLARSSFRFSPGTGRRATPGGWTFWGQANAGGFKGRPEDDLALDGTVRSAYLGADYRFGTGPLVGLALSRTTSSIGFESGVNGTGAVDARLTSLYPYAQWSPHAGLSLWGLVGAGRGTAKLSEDATGRDFATNIGMAMTAAGVRQRLTGVLAVKADAFAVRTDAEEVRGLAGVVANVQRLRLASEVGGRWGLSGGSAITSRVELGARFDGGDAETGAGAEAGAGLGYVHDGIGLSVDAQGRALVAHQASSLREWGASVAVRLQPSREAGGLSFTVEPTWGNAASGMAMLWRDGPTGGTGAGGAALGASSAWQAGGGPLAGGRAGASAGRLRMEMDYGIVLPDGGRVAPFGRWAAESGSARRLNVGVRLSVLAAATLDLFGEQVSGGAQPADRRLGLQGAVRFR